MDIVIIGAGGQSKNTSLVIEQCKKWNILGFADDSVEKKGTVIRGYKVLGSIDEVCSKYDNIGFVLAIGNPHVMEKIVTKIKGKAKNFIFPNIIHPSVRLDTNEVKMGEGNVIFPDVLCLADISIGNFNFINFKSVISHEVVIGNYCLVQPGVNVLGQCKLKNKAYVGANATLLQCKTVGENATVGAGAVVTKDVETNSIVVGNPAKLLRYKEGKKRTIMVGIIYPEMKKYFDDYIDAINAQTDKNFELFLFDNKFEEISSYLKKIDPPIKVKVIPIDFEGIQNVIGRRRFINTQ